MSFIPYVPLHVHSRFSEKDAIPDPEDYAKEIKARAEKYQCDDMKAIAITEHGHMNSFVKAYFGCKKHDIKPIIGVEVYHCVDRSIENTDRFHLVLLAKTQEGLKNLYKIASDAGMHKIKGRSGKMFAITHEETLKQYGKGIIAMTACIGGVIPQFIINGDLDGAKSKILQYKEYFDEFYLEVQPHEIKEQILVNEQLVQFSKELNIPLVITDDAHYINLEDKKYHDILKQMDHVDPFSTANTLKTPEEIFEYCKKWSIPVEAISNTVKIAKSCNTNPKPASNEGLMPNYKCPKGHDENSYLRELVMNQVVKKIIKNKINNGKNYLTRALYELDVICSKGFAGYFLILWDWFKWCRENDIIMGKGRGSAAGSIVAYVLNITSMDPIKNNFLFERFMSYLRDEAPDVDSDVAKDKRAKAIGYLLDKYGFDYVAQIITFSEYKISNTIKASMSAFNYPYQEANEVTRLIPTLIDGKDPTYNLIEDIALNPDKHPDVSAKEANDIQIIYEKMKDLFVKYPEVYDAVSKLRGVIDHTGMHAGGVVISKEKLIDNMPLTAGSKTAVLPLTQIDMDDLHKMFNALKIDVLGVNVLSKIKIAMDMARLTFDWYDSENFEDPDTYEKLSKGYTTDVFQLASFGATRLVRQLKTSEFKDIEIVDAGNRPGPLAKNKETGKSMMDLIIDAKNSGINNTLDPRIDDILQDAYGSILYQEHCMLIGQRMAGYDLGGADERIRKPLGKKKKEMMPEVRIEFVYGKSATEREITKDEYESLDELMKKRYCYSKNDKYFVYEIIKDKRGNDVPSKWCKGSLANGFDETFAHNIFDVMVEFASYCFNKPHSSSYAAIAFKTAYLMTHYPVEYAIACLSCHEKTEDITATLSQCRKLGVKILPPDINKSDVTASMEVLSDGSKAIRYGLGAISGVGATAVEVIKACRPFANFEDFIYKTGEYAKQKKAELGKYTNPISKRTIEPLIKVGVFDKWEENRFRLLNHYNTNINKNKKYEALDEETYVRKHKFGYEKELVGTYISEHPLEPFPYVNLDEVSNNEYVEITGMVKSATKKKGPKANYGLVIFECKDGTDRKAMLFGKNLEKFKSKCKKGSIIIICGNYNSSYQNINCTLVKTIEVVSSDIDDSDISNLENNLAAEVCLTESPMDELEELFDKAGA